MTERTWTELVDAIARHGDLAERLATEHRPDDNGRCTVCRVPGTNGVRRAWPCTLASLGRDAVAVHRRRRSP